MSPSSCSPPTSRSARCGLSSSSYKLFSTLITCVDVPSKERNKSNRDWMVLALLSVFCTGHPRNTPGALLRQRDVRTEESSRQTPKNRCKIRSSTRHVLCRRKTSHQAVSYGTSAPWTSVCANRRRRHSSAV
eukprot:9479941-Pyramimonas_sp.AAC.2